MQLEERRGEISQSQRYHLRCRAYASRCNAVKQTAPQVTPLLTKKYNLFRPKAPPPPRPAVMTVFRTAERLLQPPMAALRNSSRERTSTRERRGHGYLVKPAAA